MAWNIRYPKVLTDLAKAKGRGLFACGCDNEMGRWEQNGQMDAKLGTALFLFASRLYRGEVPAEAFAAIEWPGPNSIGEELRAARGETIEMD